MTHILAIDPGSTTSAWLLARREGARVRYLTSGTCASKPGEFLRVIDTVATLLKQPAHDALAAIALEVAEGMVFQPYRGPALLATAEMVGVVTAIAHDIDVPVVRMTANAVRKVLVGKASSPKKGLMDKLIADAVAANVIGWPSTSNVHVRDAAALSVVVAWQMASRRVA